ncbi:TPA: hypothetical protein ACI7NC_005082, partial [Escherichia coli]
SLKIFASGFLPLVVDAEILKEVTCQPCGQKKFLLVSKTWWSENPHSTDTGSNSRSELLRMAAQHSVSMNYFPLNKSSPVR